MDRKNSKEVSEIDPKCLGKVSASSHDGLKLFRQVGPEKWCLLRHYEKEAEKMYNFGVRPDDVWITGMPRSGTVMTEDMVWLMLNNLDLDTFKNSKNNNYRVPVFESVMTVGDLSQSVLDSDHSVVKSLKISVEVLFGNGAPIGRGRVIKTHMPFSLLPPDLLTSGCKVIYLARNPKDVIVSSFYLFANLLPHFEFIKTFEQYFDLYLNNLVLYSPYWNHIAQAWEKRHLPNFKFLFYENNTKYLRRTIEDVAEFLEVVLTTAEIDQLEKVMTFEEFKKLRPSGLSQAYPEKHTVRRGKVGGYKEYMTEEMIQKVDRWIEENSRRIGIDFPAM